MRSFSGQLEGRMKISYKLKSFIFLYPPIYTEPNIDIMKFYYFKFCLIFYKFVRVFTFLIKDLKKSENMQINLSTWQNKKWNRNEPFRRHEDDFCRSILTDGHFFTGRRSFCKKWIVIIWRMGKRKIIWK